MSGRDADPVRGKKSPTDFGEIIYDMLISIKWKHWILLFVIILITKSDVFMNRVIGKFNGALDGKSLTLYGAAIIGMMVALSMVVIDALILHEVI